MVNNIEDVDLEAEFEIIKSMAGDAGRVAIHEKNVDSIMFKVLDILECINLLSYMIVRDDENKDDASYNILVSIK